VAAPILPPGLRGKKENRNRILFMNNTREFLKGKKTYGVALVGALYLLGCWVGWFEMDEKVLAGLGLGFMATFRSALKGIFPATDTLPKVSSAEDTNRSGNGGGNQSGAALGIFLMGLVGTLALPLVGCSTLADKFTTPVVAARTNVVTVVVTNFVPIAVRVPGETVTVTNIVEKLFTNTVERVTTVTNYVAKESIAEGLQVAKTGAAVGGVFNPGAGAIASGVLGVASLGLGWMVRRKNNEAVDARAEAESLALQLEATIRGVETAGIMNPEEGKRVKEAISKFSNALGAQPELHAAVQAITK
jgi:hypothetical protein